jgi:tetratricopeptide (TPR) repeat protein
VLQRNQTLRRSQQEALIGREHFLRGRWGAARDHFLEAIRLEPDCADYYFNAAICCWSDGQVREAGEYLQAAVRIKPSLGAAQAWLGEWYLSQGLTDSALKATAAAIDLEPRNPEFMRARAWVLAAGDPDAAWEIVRKLIARTPMTPSLVRLYGLLAGRFGQETQALAAIERLLKVGPAPAESSLYFTAAELLDRAGRYDEAFSLAAKANGLYGGAPYDPAAFEHLTYPQIDYFTRERVRSMPKATLRSDKPVFIVGMPRSGTSLVEQILASHPAVHGAGELDFIHHIWVGTLDMLRSDFGQYPKCLDNLTTAQVDGMADVYLSPLVAMRPDATRITDKMPQNFLHLGLIASLFPSARIIHCTRDPMDTCLSCFMTHFNYPQPFKHNLAHLGHFYRLYEKLMTHWKAVIDPPLLEVSYEEVIANPEAQSRRMLEFLDVPWNDRCLSFHQTKRPCATASVMQVRRPIYGSSVGRWRHYEKHLGPLKTGLETFAGCKMHSTT